MKDILLNYVMKVDAYAPLPSASSAYIRKVLCVVKPKGEEVGTITECLEKTQVQALTDANCWKLLEAGMNSIYVLPSNDLKIGDIIDNTDKKFFTILIDGAFSNEETNAMTIGTFNGVIGWTTETQEEAKQWGYGDNNVGFYDLAENGSQNMYWAFGKLLSANNWKNQQYIVMPLSSKVTTINKANLLFEDSVSFVLTSEEYGNRLALFASNRRAIIAPYAYEEATLKLQSKALQYINLNQPSYTEAEASLLEDALQGVLDEFIEDGIFTNANINVRLTNEQFVLDAEAEVSEPKALWRIKATMKQGEI
jgi:hypothetical protein|nr:MAG TPA: hypothetical protein [Caudoviricetes sp.]